MSSSQATSLHTMADVGSLQLVNSMSDTYDVDSRVMLDQELLCSDGLEAKTLVLERAM